VALHTYTQGFTEVEDLGVGHPQFSRQLIDADVLRHGGFVVLFVGGVCWWSSARTGIGPRIKEIDRWVGTGRTAV